MICSFNISKVWEFFSSLFFLQLEKLTNFGIYLRFCSVQGVENVVPFFYFYFTFIYGRLVFRYLYIHCISTPFPNVLIQHIKCTQSIELINDPFNIYDHQPRSRVFFWNPPLFFLCTYKCCLPVHIIHLMKDSQSQILVRSIQSVRVPYCRPIGV